MRRAYRATLIMVRAARSRILSFGILLTSHCVHFFFGGKVFYQTRIFSYQRKLCGVVRGMHMRMKKSGKIFPTWNRNLTE